MTQRFLYESSMTLHSPQSTRAKNLKYTGIKFWKALCDLPEDRIYSSRSFSMPQPQQLGEISRNTLYKTHYFSF